MTTVTTSLAGAEDTTSFARDKIASVLMVCTPASEARSRKPRRGGRQAVAAAAEQPCKKNEQTTAIQHYSVTT